ncbi:hypothetical protein ACFUCV_05685 [Specibacter sp. NPDC057265]|uniref:hypothetical protein n=1 Tax=Specibacter sp. NPDC057265 TaxID=3346075 RepID=UPI00363B0693
MVGVFARGRITWMLGIALGVVLLVVGIFLPSTWLIVAGAVIAVFCAVFLILSYVTHGQTD